MTPFLLTTTNSGLDEIPLNDGVTSQVSSGEKVQLVTLPTNSYRYGLGVEPTTHLREDPGSIPTCDEIFITNYR